MSIDQPRQIGLEMGTVNSALGARLDVVEMLDGLMQGADLRPGHATSRPHAIGRKIAVDKAGVAVTDRGFIKVNIQMRTNVPYKAVHEAHVAAEVMAGELQGNKELAAAAFNARGACSPGTLPAVLMSTVYSNADRQCSAVRPEIRCPAPGRGRSGCAVGRA